MSTVISPGADTLTPPVFDTLAAALARANRGGLTLDLRTIRFIDPFGVISLLFWLRAADAAGHRVTCWLPQAPEVAAYLATVDFFAHADRCALLVPPPRPVRAVPRPEELTLELTPIRVEEDVETVVRCLIDRVQAILSHNLRYNAALLGKISVALAEICQNIPQHSEDWGLAVVQCYQSHAPGKERFVKLAVGDLGIGIRASLSGRTPHRELTDGEAIASALELGVSRLAEEGRGLGLATVAAFAREWEGTLQVRSGRARVIVRGDRRHRFTVPYFPGTQISLEFPALDLFAPGSPPRRL